MGYGNFIYRRPSGIYVFRLTVPESHRKWFNGAEIHQSTHLRDRGPAAAVAQQLRVAWSSIMSELLVMDLSAIDSGSRLISGDGEVALGDVAIALHTDVPTVALEMAHGGVKLFVFADDWRATRYDGSLSSMWHEDGVVPYVEIENAGEDCTLRGLVELADPKDVGRRLKNGQLVVVPYEVNDPVFGRCFVARPGQPSVDPARIFVRKVEVATWRSSGLAASLMAPRPIESNGGEVVTQPFVPTLADVPPIAPLALPFIASPESAAPGQTSHTPQPTDALARPAIPLAEGGRFASMRMSEVVDKFVTAMTASKPGGLPKWKPEEGMRNRNKLDTFCDLTGNPTMGELQLIPESEDLVERFLERAIRLPTGPMLTRARASARGSSATDLISWADETGVEKRMSLQTARNSYLSKASECLKWAVKRTFIAANPCATVLENTTLDPMIFKRLPRQPLSPEELNRVFGSVWFRDGRPIRTASGKGDLKFRTYHYWLPLLAIYAGGRINELSQLYLDDFRTTATGLNYISFNLDQPDKVQEDVDEQDDEFDGSSLAEPIADKSLKTKNSWRDVPLHDELLRLGLVEYVAALRSAGHQRLFPELRLDRDKGYGADPRKWFNDRFLGMTLKIPRDNTRVFHSLRHNFTVKARHAGLFLRERQQLLGHKRGGSNTADQDYDHDDELRMLLPKLNKVSYPIPTIGAFDVEAGLIAIRYKLAWKKADARKAKARLSVGQPPTPIVPPKK